MTNPKRFKTIVFNSLKGGVGKSLAAANLAVCLSRLGKHCVLLDLDCGGPSLHHKFSDAHYSPGKGGFLKYFLEHIEGEKWPLHFPPQVKYPGMNALREDERNQREDPLLDLRYYSTLLRCNYAKKAGAIHLLSGGDVNNPEYIDLFNCPLFNFTVTVPLECDHARAAADEPQHVLEYCARMRAVMEKLEPAPEYLIIDVRSGSQELSAFVHSMWQANVSVCMLSFNADNLVDYAPYIRKLKDYLQGTSRTLTLVLVLSRIPTGVEFRGDRGLVRLMETVGVGYDDLHLLHSDRDLETNETLYLGYDGTISNRRLTHDYVKLFASIIETADIPNCTEDDSVLVRKAKLADAIGLPCDLHQQDRVFQLEADNGSLINPNDGSRNVSFKVRTFQLLLGGLREAIGRIPQGGGHYCKMQLGKDPSGKTNTWFDECLFVAGEKCGQAFGEALAETWAWRGERSPDREALGVEDRLERWCSFDSDVGFGRFDLDITSLKVEGTHLRSCDVTLRESFLTAGMDTDLGPDEGHAYCEWMRGYISGVLNKILKHQVTVEHYPLTEKEAEARFGESERRSASCRFGVVSALAR